MLLLSRQKLWSNVKAQTSQETLWIKVMGLDGLFVVGDNIIGSGRGDRCSPGTEMVYVAGLDWIGCGLGQRCCQGACKFVLPA